MERSEPALVPEWLRSSSTSQNSVSSSSQSEDHAIARPTRSRSSANSGGDYDRPRSSAFPDRNSSSYFNRNSGSNGSVMHEKNPSSYSRSYSSSGRSHRDRDWELDLLDFSNKERPVVGDHRDGYLTPSGVNANPFTSRSEKEALRRSRSMLSGKRGELRPRPLARDLKSVNTDDHSSSSSLVVGGTMTGSTHKATFERDFPSLGAEERQVASDIARVSSPVLSSAIQSLPCGSSVIGRDGWTSALAEVPVNIGSSMGLSSVKQSSPASPASAAPSSTTGLNMAETIAQAPSRARTAPQISVETQRLEELAIKQSRQLIPMTPLMPKTSALSLEKPKSKVGVRSEMNLALKVGNHQQSPSLLVNHSPRGGNAMVDAPKTGKLLVLKPAREKNGISPNAKDSSSPTNAGSITSNPSTVTPSATFSPNKQHSNNQKPNSIEQKPSAARPAIHLSHMEKRSTVSQAQSRNDFFNLMRKKTSPSTSSTAADPTSVLPSTVSEGFGEIVEIVTEVSSAPVTPIANEEASTDLSCPDWLTVNGTDTASNGDACEEPPCEKSPCEESLGYLNNGERRPSSLAKIVNSDEEEVAFLRSLGWDENAEEEEGLTEEEINGFYKKLQLKPLMKVHQKLPAPVKSQVGSFDRGSSDSDSDA